MLLHAMKVILNRWREWNAENHAADFKISHRTLFLLAYWKNGPEKDGTGEQEAPNFDSDGQSQGELGEII